MRIIPDEIGEDIQTVLHAVSKDRESWREWQYVHIETLTNPAASAWLSAYKTVNRILEIYLENRDCTVFLCGRGAIHVFCKDSSVDSLRDMCNQIVKSITDGAHIAARYHVYDMESDYDRLLDRLNGQETKDAALSPHQSEHGMTPKGELSQFAGPKVLLVEDDPVTRWMVSTAVGDHCRLVTASDARKALHTYLASKPDMVFLDINLPDQSGMDLMNTIIASDPGAYIVMFSSQDTLENIVSCIESGAKGFIAKPFSKDHLLQYVHRCPNR